MPALRPAQPEDLRHPIIRALLIATMAFAGLGASARTIFFDDFEPSGSARTSIGFSWGDTSRNVYTTTDPLTGARPTPYRGRSALAFSHRARPVGQDSTAQRAFSLGGAYPDLWIRYFVRIPDNFAHRVERDGSNNKWLCLWNDRYTAERTGMTICWSYVPSETSPGGSDIVYDYIAPGADGKTYWSPQLARRSFISASMKGKWIEVVHHVQMPSRQGAGDGAIQMWIRPPNVPNLVSLQDDRAVSFRWGTGPRGFTAGYLMGWSNSGFTEATTFNIDDFQVLDSRPTGLTEARVAPVTHRSYRTADRSRVR